MDKNQFLNLLKNPGELTEELVSELKIITKEHPYCQIPYFLIARNDYQNNGPDKERSIQMASAYALDRKVLKKFVTEVRPIKKEETYPSEETIPEPGIENQENPNTIEGETYAPDSPLTESKSEIAKENLAEEVISNIQNLKEQKDNFNRISDEENDNHQFENNSSSEENLSNPIVEKGLDDQEASPDTEYFFTEELEKIEPTAEKPNFKIKIQNELIEKFIKSRPSLIRPEKSLPEDQEDLAEKASVADSNLISENLAIIMVKQGKIEKAIDIYKKLIWKYPQKKAYFANRIEELKK